MPNTENRRRRVSDRPDSLLNPAEQAVRIQRIEGEHQLLAQRVTSGMESVTNTLGNVQLEVRALNSSIRELAGLQHSNDSNKGAIERIESSVKELRQSVEEWFDTYESKNEDAKARLSEQIQKVREDTIRIFTVGAVVTVLGGAVITGFLWNINRQFADEHEVHQQQRAISDANRSMIDKTRDEVYDVKLYLARGGRIPDEPYTPPTQRSKPNEQPKLADSAGKP